MAEVATEGLNTAATAMEDIVKQVGMYVCMYICWTRHPANRVHICTQTNKHHTCVLMCIHMPGHMVRSLICECNQICVCFCVCVHIRNMFHGQVDEHPHAHACRQTARPHLDHVHTLIASGGTWMLSYVRCAAFCVEEKLK